MTLFHQKPAGAADDAAPLSGKGGNAAHPCPGGHFCCGCSRYGTVCLRPCYRDTDLREKLLVKSAGALGPRPLPHSPTDATMYP